MIHWGRSNACETPETRKKIFDHALKVNGTTPDVMLKEIEAAFQIWQQLSQRQEWVVTWDEWQNILKKKGIEISE